MFKNRSRDSQFLVMMFIVAILLGVSTFFSLLDNEEVVVASSTNNLTRTNNRSPSSIPNSLSTVFNKKETFQFAEYNLNCPLAKNKKSAFKKNVVGNYMLIQGQNCLKDFKDGDIEIFNKSNGYTASTLTSGVDKFQTDLIQLQKGENQIIIRYRTVSGKFVDEVFLVQSTEI